MVMVVRIEVVLIAIAGFSMTGAIEEDVVSDDRDDTQPVVIMSTAAMVSKIRKVLHFMRGS